MLGSVDDISSDVQFLLPWDWPWPLRMCCWVRACKPRAAGKDCHPFFGKVWASQPWKKTFRENKISWDLPSQFFGAEDGWSHLAAGQFQHWQECHCEPTNYHRGLVSSQHLWSANPNWWEHVPRPPVLQPGCRGETRKVCYPGARTLLADRQSGFDDPR